MPEDNTQTEQTRKGLAVPVRKREEFFANLTKAAEPDKADSAPAPPAPPAPAPDKTPSAPAPPAPPRPDKDATPENQASSGNSRMNSVSA